MKFRKDDVPLSFSPVTGKFTVIDELHAYWQGRALIVPHGFETDLASIPRRLRGIVAQVGRHIQAAIFHDMAYTGAFDMTRKEADDMFYDGMVALGVPWYRRMIMYAAVRVGGRSSWQG